MVLRTVVFGAMQMAITLGQETTIHCDERGRYGIALQVQQLDFAQDIHHIQNLGGRYFQCDGKRAGSGRNHRVYLDCI